MTEAEQDLVDLHSILMMGNKWEYKNLRIHFLSKQHIQIHHPPLAQAKQS